MKPLLAEQKSALEASVAPNHRVLWHEGWLQRITMARLLALNGKVRLLLPEAFDVHRRSIEWGAFQSEDRIPDHAIGLDPILLKVTEWAFRSWERLDFLNRYLAGTVFPRLELDFFPAVRCGAHFALIATSVPQTKEQFIDGGRAVQRFWLTADCLGLKLQPAVSPLVFARYLNEHLTFTANDYIRLLAEEVRDGMASILGGRSVLKSTVFAGRIGFGKPPKSRSVRLPLSRLIVPKSPQ